MLTVLLLIAGVILLLAVLSVLGYVEKYLKALTALTEAKTENVEADTEVILNPPDNDVDPDEDPDYNPYEEDDHEGLGEDTVIDPLPLLKLVALFRAARQAREAAQAQAQSQVEVGVDADGCFIHATSEPEPEPTPNPETVEVPAGVTLRSIRRDREQLALWKSQQNKQKLQLLSLTQLVTQHRPPILEIQSAKKEALCLQQRSL